MPAVGATPKPKGSALRACLIPERRKAVFLALFAVVGFFAFRSIFFTSAPDSFTVSHVLSSEEKDVLRQQILQQEEQRLRDQLDQLKADAAEQRAELSSKLDIELEREPRDDKAIARLRGQIAALDKDTATKSQEVEAKFKDEIEGIISAQLEKLQREIIDSRADEMLVWFCEAEIHDESVSVSVEDAPVDLFEQPCVGVASQGDPPVPLRRFYYTSQDVTYAVAKQFAASLANRSDEASNLEIATSQFNPRKSSGCCDTLMFAVHPVFGMFYKLNVPYTDPSADDLDDAPEYFTETVCFRRKFHPQPVIRPLTPDSAVSHLTDPAKYLPKLSDSADGGRRLSKSKPAAPSQPPSTDNKFAPGTVHVILPFRAANLGLLPSLIKNFGRLKSYTAAPFRLILAPVDTSSDLGFDVMARVQEAIAVAGPALGIDITVSSPPSDTTKAALSPILRDWIDAKKVPDFTDIAALPPNDLLNNPLLTALIGALSLVPKTRSPVLLLDSTTFSVPNDFVKKTLWRIINGRMIYAPIASAVEGTDLPTELLGSGDITVAPSALSNDQDPKFRLASFWLDVGGLSDPHYNRRLRANKAPKNIRGVAPRARVLSSPVEGGARAAQVEESNGSVLQDDDDFNSIYGQMDDLFSDFDSESEWAPLNPTLYDDLEDLYGVGEGFGDDDGYHAYYVPADDDDDMEGQYRYFGADDLMDDDLEELGDFYVDDEDLSVPLNSLMTTLAATKSDIASMIFRVLDVPASAPQTGTVEGDACVLRRLLNAARTDGFKIVRAQSQGLLVSDPGAASPCSCDADPTSAHCSLVLPQSAVDDDIDQERVNCVLTLLYADQGIQTNAEVREEGVDGDIDIAEIVSVSHAVRFVKPSVGIEIVAKVFAASPAPANRALTEVPPPALSPEIFSFQWPLSSKIKLLEEVLNDRR